MIDLPIMRGCFVTEKELVKDDSGDNLLWHKLVSQYPHFPDT